jgi:DNA (cytosine-5)-methyltransferase 1
VKHYAYYNEIDQNCCAWIRQLMLDGLIMQGEVDGRSIVDVEANELAGFTRHHFFSGIAGWDYALRLAGWPEDSPVWTGSAPCQSFSVAGKGKGKADERHLWPEFYRLIRECRPPVIFGEQVEGAVKHGWACDLQADLEREGYAFGFHVLGAHSAGAPHIRQRLYWMAHRCGKGLQGHRGFKQEQVQEKRHGAERYDSACSSNGWLGDTELHGHDASEGGRSIEPGENESGLQQPERPSSVWADCEWLYCRDGKYRPIKPGLKPLAAKLPAGMVYSGDQGAPINADETQEARVMRLMGYGNAIQIDTASSFIKAAMGCI